MMKMKIKNNLKGEEMSKGKINPKVQSANDTMIAEMLIEEIDKLSSLYTKVLEREDKIDSQYQKVEKMFANHKLELIEFSKYINRYNDYIKKYEGLSKNAVELANQLFDISKAGFSVDEASKKEIYKTANAGIKPLEQYLKWITYGIGLAFLFLLIIILIIWLFM